MSKNSIQQFSTTAASNTDIAGINVNVGWPPGNVGSAYRTLMAFLANSLVPLSLSIAAQTAVTLTPAQAAAQFVVYTGALTADCTVTLPNALFIGYAQNGTTGGHNVIFTSGGGTTISIPPSTGWYVYECDGSGNTKIVSGLGTISPVMEPVTSAGSLASALASLSTLNVNTFGTPAFGVSSATNQNAIIGAVNNNSAPATNSFPCGITGYGVVSAGATGNTAYGVFGRADLNDRGVALNEFDSFNFSGHAASMTTPPDLSIGTTGYYPIAALLAAYGTSSSAIGLMVAYGDHAFETGIYMHPSAYNTTGLFIDALNSGSNAVPALIRGSGVKPMLTLQAMNGAGGAPANAMFELQDALGNVAAYMNQAGDYINAGFSIAASGMLTFLNAGVSPTATGGAASALPAAPFKYVTVTVNGTVGKIPFYNT